MKAIQFKKTDCQLSGNNHLEICKEFDCRFEFVSGIWNISKIAIIKTTNQELYVQLGNWVLKENGTLRISTTEDHDQVQTRIVNEANNKGLLAPDQNPNDINAAKKRSNGLTFKGFPSDTL